MITAENDMVGRSGRQPWRSARSDGLASALRPLIPNARRRYGVYAVTWFLVQGLCSRACVEQSMVLMYATQERDNERHYLERACCRASYTSASMRASTLSSSEPLPAATFNASWRLARTAYRRLSAGGARFRDRQYYLRRERLERSSLNSVDGELVVGVDGREAARDYRSSAHKARCCKRARIHHSPNHFFDWLLPSMTSTTPGRRGSIVGAWLARIPMSPDAAARFTWTTSAEVKIACSPVITGVRGDRCWHKPGGGGRATRQSCRRPQRSLACRARRRGVLSEQQR